jgi:hypothetical protein
MINNHVIEVMHSIGPDTAVKHESRIPQPGFRSSTTISLSPLVINLCLVVRMRDVLFQYRRTLNIWDNGLSAPRPNQLLSNNIARDTIVPR